MAFLTPTVIKWLAIAAILLAAFASGWIKGNAHGTQKLVDHVQKQAAEATRLAQARTKVSERVVKRYLEKKGATERVTEFIDREVKIYADANPANMCIDAAWLRLHDTAAINAIPKPPAVPASFLREAKAGAGHADSGAGSGYRYTELLGTSSLR